MAKRKTKRDPNAPKLPGGITGKGFVPGDPRINRKGRPRKMVLSDAYLDILENPLPFDPDPKKFKEHIAKMIQDGSTGAEIVAVLMYANIFRGDNVSVATAVELRKATEGDAVHVNDVKVEARKRLADLGLSEDDVWERDPELARHLAAIGAIAQREMQAPGE